MTERRSWLLAVSRGQWRVAVLVVALVTTALKLWIAANTFGTDDVHYWTEFAQGVREFGPFGIYGKPFAAQYNHPPLTSMLLAYVAWLADHGFGTLPYLIRVPASVADVATAWLVFGIVRSYRAVHLAGLAGLAVAVSPALVVISGFHGNTDPVFVVFALLAVYLVAVRGSSVGGGFAFAAAVSIKLVPVVLAPLMLVLLIRAGWRALFAFVVGAAALAVPLWGPLIVAAWPEFSANVLGYQGIALREWGLPQFLTWVRAPGRLIELVVGPGRFVVLLLSAVVPAYLVWRRPAAVGPAVGVALGAFLLLSPAFGMQYVVWPLAAAYLVGNVVATVYNVTASMFVLAVYSDWNGVDAPWGWFEAEAMPFRFQEKVLMILTWCALAAVVTLGVDRAWRRPKELPTARVSMGHPEERGMMPRLPAEI
ncbi:glycosyltransferase family 87 protein [Actinomycetes bacterium KLBMP 9759]